MIFEGAERLLAYLTRDVKKQIPRFARDDSRDGEGFASAARGRGRDSSTSGRDVRFASVDKTVAAFVVPGTWARTPRSE